MFQHDLGLYFHISISYLKNNTSVYYYVSYQKYLVVKENPVFQCVINWLYPTSSGVRLQPEETPMLSSSCLMDVQPMMTDVTTSCCISHRNATWATLFPGETYYSYVTVNCKTHHSHMLFFLQNTPLTRDIFLQNTPLTHAIFCKTHHSHVTFFCKTHHSHVTFFCKTHHSHVTLHC